MRPPPTEAPAWLAPFLAEVFDAIAELQFPTFPRRVCRVASTALPPASSVEPGSVVDLTDLNTLGKCDGTNWRRVDTGAIVP